MQSDDRWQHVFEELEPPPGGLDRLRTRLAGLEGPAGPRRSTRPLVLATAAAVAAAVVLWLAPAVFGPLPGGPELTAAWDNPALIRMGVVEMPREPVTVPPADWHRTAVTRVSGTDPAVVFYRVATLGGDGG